MPFELAAPPRGYDPFMVRLRRAVSVRAAYAFGDWPPVDSYPDPRLFDPRAAARAARYEEPPFGFEPRW